MALRETLEQYVRNTFEEEWIVRDGRKVPDPSDVQQRNVGVKLEATVLYADLDGSTNLVDTSDPTFAAEVYKTYLYCAAKIIRERGGDIVSYDGDRIMAVFMSTNMNTRAVKAAMQINWAVVHLINPYMEDQYGPIYRVRQVVGIDTGPVMAAQTGIRGTNDLVWVGRAANYAAKLTEMSSDYPTWITSAVYRKIAPIARTGDEGEAMWAADTWAKMGNARVYKSDWHWSL